MANEKIKILDKTNFDEAIAGETPILVDFWASWCGPCRMVAPILDELADEYDGKLSIGKVDVDANNELAGRFGVMSIPTLLVFKGGQEQGKIVGAMPKNQLAGEIDKIIG